MRGEKVERAFIAALIGMFACSIVGAVSIALQTRGVWPGVLMCFSTTTLIVYRALGAER